MKPLTTLLLLLLCHYSYAQTPINETAKIATFCKVWGFLKYHHPAVAKGKYNWDQQFIDHITTIRQLNSKADINHFYYTWITGLGKLKKNSQRQPPADAILSNYDNAWLKDSTVFTSEVTTLLLCTQNNTRSKNKYAKKRFFGFGPMDYFNEKNAVDSIYPSADRRLLTLAIYWNIVNYFYPYKYLTDNNWQHVITAFIPKFIDADNVRNYRLTCLELFAQVNDSHTGLKRSLLDSSIKLPPFHARIVEDMLVVLSAINDSLNKKSDMRYGDVITHINGQPVRSRIDHYARYISASNHASLCRQLSPDIIWRDLPDMVVVSCERDGKVVDKMIPLLPVDELVKNRPAPTQPAAPARVAKKYTLIDSNIAYLNLARLHSSADAETVLADIKNTHGVIIDIRNYPNSGLFAPITNFFCESRKPFARFAKQSVKYPGVLLWATTRYCGKNSGEKYKGKVVVLTFEGTMSFAEYFTMALKTIPGVLLVGTHTAGADGGNTHFQLPGNITTSFSNEAVYYPDGGETQRKGIVPDIIVTPTIEGVRRGKDEALEKAIDILRGK